MRLNLPPAIAALALCPLALAGCSPASGLAVATPEPTTVKMDFFHRPLPEIPLPNDVATRYDPTSATGRRVNASMIAPTGFEEDMRRHLDRLDGWGVFQPITIPFTGPLDVSSILAGHRDKNYDPSNDVVYLINIDRRSPSFGKQYPLDLGNGNYQVVLKNRDYYKDDPRGDSLSLPFDETEEDVNGDGKMELGEDLNGNGVLDPGEDVNGNGKLDPPEDTDADGILDHPNYLPGAHPAADDLGARADALMTFYDSETDTLIARPLVPLDERTTYAVVVTRRLKDAAGNPVGSPYPYINHTSQTEALQPLPEVLPAGLSMSDVAFAFTFTTQTIESGVKAVRDGLYGHGVQAQLATDYPARLASLEPMRDAAMFPGLKKPTLMYGEDWAKIFPLIATRFLNEDASSQQYKDNLDSIKYIDYLVIGSYQSPQLFPRDDADGNPLPLNDQSWPEDLDRVPAPARSETVYFTLAVPRKEVSARAQGKQVPVVIVGHGYGSNRFEGMEYAGYLAKHGLASFMIDGPSHGLAIDPATRGLIVQLFAAYGLEGAGKAILHDRAFDQNNDGTPDSGADFWTAYLFHTRDMVRQFMLDYMQAIRILRTFDGTRRWAFDVDGDGQPELAGDFDADGQVDIGKDSPIYFMGGSLGGMMSMLMGGVEPEVTAIAPIAGGGGLSDIGIRSQQGGVIEAFILRGMGPMYTGTIDATSGDLTLETIVPDLNRTADDTLAVVKGVHPGDTMVVENLANGKRGCGYLTADGKVRAQVQSDVGDPYRVLFYPGPQLAGDTECGLREGAPAPSVIVDKFGVEVKFQGRDFPVGAPLQSLAEGLGLRRGHPDLRRFQALGQMVLDPADMASYARHLLLDPMTYPGTGQTTGTHALVMTSNGDMNVPASSGLTFDRAAGLVDYLHDDPRYGEPDNQKLIDLHIAEADNILKRYTDHAGNGVMLDVENFSQGTDRWGSDIPRLDPPMHLGFDKTDALGGKSAAVFEYTHPEGQHAFDLPGIMTDDSRAACKAACTDTGADPCGCEAKQYFDVGLFMFNMVGRYFASGGTYLSDDLCMSADSCLAPWDWQPPPAARPQDQLP